MAGGIAAGQAAVGMSKHLPRHIFVAVSPTDVYLHSKALVGLLLMSEEHHDEEPSEDELV